MKAGSFILNCLLWACCEHRRMRVISNILGRSIELDGSEAMGRDAEQMVIKHL